MEIKYLGHSSFLIKSKDVFASRDEARLVTDPFNQDFTGLHFPKTEADIITISHNHKDHNAVKEVDGTPLVIDMPGEFEKKGIRIFGYQSYHDDKKGAERGENIIYKIESEGISVLHCGDLGFVPDDNFIESLGDVNVLIVPIGGTHTINSDQAITLIRKIEPTYVIPMHFASAKHNEEFKKNLETVDEFIKKMGVESVDLIPKLSIKKEDLITVQMKVVLLEA